MFPEDSSGSPANSAENGVDFREVLYGSGRPGGPSGVGRVQQPYSEGGPLSPTRGPPSESSPPQGNWGINTSYGDWLLASSSASPKQPLLLERVQRVGEVQRLRDAASYRGPSGISQPRLQQQQQQQQQQPVLYSRSLRAEDSQRDNKAYLGAVGEGPYVGAREGGGPQCMQPSPSVYGLREQQRESMQRPLLDFSSPQDLRESNTDVYVLAPDSDTGMTENERDVLPLFADGGAPRSLRRRSFTTAAEGSGWGPPPAAEEGPLGGPLEGPLEGAPPFERLSPLDVSKGPLKKRQPTDVWCLCLFCGCWIVLIWLVGSSLSGASPQKLTAGIDWSGRVCGADEGVKDLPFLYWPSKEVPRQPVDFELDSCNLIPVCTSRCPEAFSSQRLSGLCDLESEKKGFCSWYSSLPPLLMLKRFCVFSENNKSPKDHGILHSWFHWVGDLALVWPLAFIVPLFSFLLAFGFFWVFRKAASSVIKLMVATIEIILMSSSYYFFSLARNSGVHTPELHAAPTNLPSWLYLFLGVIFAVFSILFIIITIVYWQQLSLCTSVLKTAAFVLNEAPSNFLAFLPIFTSVAFASHTAFALLGFLHLMASKSYSPSLPLKVCGPVDPFHRLSLDFFGRLSLVFLLLMAFWTSAFISNVCQLIISYFTACSYFTPHDADRKQILEAKAAESAKVIFRYHLGSAALGGLWLSVVEVLRICLCWIRRIHSQRNETVFRWILRTVANALAALHAALSLLTQTAFVYVSLLGQPLLRAALTAAAAQKRNPVGVAFVWQFGRLLQIAGQVLVASVVTWAVYVILPIIPGTYGADGQLSSLTSPLLFSFFVSFTVASSCMKCFGFASLTLLQCYLADVEMARQEGKSAPQFAPRSLRAAQKHLLKRQTREV